MGRAHEVRKAAMATIENKIAGIGPTIPIAINAK